MAAKKSGFTIIELVMVTTIIGILAGVTAPLIKASFDTWYYVLDRKEVVYNAKLAMQTMIRDSRQVKNATSILAMTSTRFRFTNVNNVTIDFQLSGTTITKNGSILARNVQATSGLAFSYLDGAGNVTALAASVRTVVITIILTNQSQQYSMQSRVSPRNLGV